jgi:hypothetical protein
MLKLDVEALDPTVKNSGSFTPFEVPGGAVIGFPVASMQFAIPLVVGK